MTPRNVLDKFKSWENRLKELKRIMNKFNKSFKNYKSICISKNKKKYHRYNTEQYESKGEAKCRRIFEKITQHKFSSVWHYRIINPKTGCRLQLDGYCKGLKIAFEYNGRQHYKYTEYFHKNGEIDFYEQIERDAYKIKRCRELNIHLIVIKHDKKDLENFIISELYKINPYLIF